MGPDMSTKRASACPNLDSPVPVASTKRLGACDDTATATLPVDLLLEITVRSDSVTVVRCAAVSKPLRAAILDHSFRRRLGLRAFDPSLLRGISYKLEANRVVDLVQTESIPVRSKLPSLSFEPVAWRDGIIVFRRYSCGQNHADVAVNNDDSPTEQLTVCNSITGHTHTISLPPVAVRENHYPPALFTVDDDDNFELLVADKDLGTRIYSSRDGEWSAARAAHHAVHPPPKPLSHRNKHPVVIGRTVHWLCVPGWCDDIREAHYLHIVALDVDAARATVIELPQGCVSRMNGCKNNNGITLAVSADGTGLSLVVSETQVFWMWSLSVAGGWSRRVLMDKQQLGVQAVHQSVRFEGFGERSGTVLFHMTNVGLVQFNLATKEALAVLPMRERDPITTTNISQVCLHEINLASILRAMKPYT